MMHIATKIYGIKSFRTTIYAISVSNVKKEVTESTADRPL
jgi:hypothetical protein